MESYLIEMGSKSSDGKQVEARGVRALPTSPPATASPVMASSWIVDNDSG